MIFKQINPFLKGLHQTLDSWRPNCDDDGWKLSRQEWDLLLANCRNEEEKEQLVDAHNKGHLNKIK